MWNIQAKEFVPGGKGGPPTMPGYYLWHGCGMMPPAIPQYFVKGAWNGWGHGGRLSRACRAAACRADLRACLVGPPGTWWMGGRLGMQQKGGWVGGWAGWKGSPPHGWQCGGGGSGGGLGGPGEDTVPPPGQGATPVRTFAAIWNLDPKVYWEDTVLRRVLTDIDLEPFALVRIPDVAGAFELEYADSYSAASAALALDRVAPRRKVLQAQDGVEVRAAEWPFDQQCFKEGDLPMELQLWMQKRCWRRSSALIEAEGEEVHWI